MIKLNMLGKFYTNIWLSMASLNLRCSQLRVFARVWEWSNEGSGRAAISGSLSPRSSVNNRGQCIRLHNGVIIISPLGRSYNCLVVIYSANCSCDNVTLDRGSDTKARSSCPDLSIRVSPPSIMTWADDSWSQKSECAHQSLIRRSLPAQRLRCQHF